MHMQSTTQFGTAHYMIWLMFFWCKSTYNWLHSGNLTQLDSGHINKESKTTENKLSRVSTICHESMGSIQEFDQLQIESKLDLGLCRTFLHASDFLEEISFIPHSHVNTRENIKPWVSPHLWRSEITFIIFNSSSFAFQNSRTGSSRVQENDAGQEQRRMGRSLQINIFAMSTLGKIVKFGNLRLQI